MHAPQNMKPFKPPSLLGKQSSSRALSAQSSEPPRKKLRTSSDDSALAKIETVAVQDNALKKSEAIKKFHLPNQLKPLNGASPRTLPSDAAEGYYTVLWRNITMKKNKTWDGDGFIAVCGGYATLQDISGKEMGRTACPHPPVVGSELSIGGKDVSVEAEVSKENVPVRRPFLGDMKQQPRLPSQKSVDKASQLANEVPKNQAKASDLQTNKHLAIGAATKSSKAVFKAPLLYSAVRVTKRESFVPVPRHDPNAEGALVMKRPKDVPKGRQIVDVVVDPILTRELREHQREGVSFLYECVMGMKRYSGEGAILADEMGLGKTLQTIALLWTLLKQNPVYGDSPVIKKALIVCPVTLIDNWRREIYKWLGKERMGVFVAENNKMRLTDFTHGKSYSIMVIGYEKLRMVQGELQKGSGIDIVIADEGHRLKTAQNKSALAIRSLDTERRIILSGTPIQNDLAEFYTMVDFVNPGLLGRYGTFKREFESPILRSRQPAASTKDLEKGKAQIQELASITNMFILRRTAEINSKYLPPKTEYVVLCRPTKVQALVYRAIMASPAFNAAFGSPAISLEIINVLKKVCNSTTLLKKSGKEDGDAKPALLDSVPSSLLHAPGASGKLTVLRSLLHQIRTTTSEKVVLVSNYTSTMDVLANLLSSLSYSFFRLDGSTPPGKRQSLVDRFNCSPPSNSFVFLLSAKAGGVGLNLIGASRLVLFDLDWNPATDFQAMARIHRDKQKRPCFIYRLLTQGALDEKIFQRQVSKAGLAESIVDARSGVNGFTHEELQDIFGFDEGQDCQTHRLLGCTCRSDGILVSKPNEAISQIPNDPTSRHVDNAVFVGVGSEQALPEGSHIDYEANGDSTVTRPRHKLVKGAHVGKVEHGVDVDQKPRQGRDKESVKMLGLMQYAHFDTSLIQPLKHNLANELIHINKELSDYELPDNTDVLEVAIKDDVLRNVLLEDSRRIGFVFAKTNK